MLRLDKLQCGGCARCHDCAALMSQELHSMLVCWHPAMGPDYAKLREELDELEDYLDRESEAQQIADWEYEQTHPYESRGLWKGDFY